jgi:hypothetical protein
MFWRAYIIFVMNKGAWIWFDQTNGNKGADR